MRAKLLIWVALAMLLANSQCVASCAVLTCDLAPSGPVPPCHQHHDDSSPSKVPVCLHRNVIARAASAPEVAMPAVVVEITAEFQAASIVLAVVAVHVDPSPPDLPGVLRI
jgi:hypothetical protein